MPYLMHACRACDALITDGVDPTDHGPEDERCPGDERGTERVELFTEREMRERTLPPASPSVRLARWADEDPEREHLVQRPNVGPKEWHVFLTDRDDMVGDAFGDTRDEAITAALDKAEGVQGATEAAADQREWRIVTTFEDSPSRETSLPVQSPEAVTRDLAWRRDQQRTGRLRSECRFAVEERAHGPAPWVAVPWPAEAATPEGASDVES